MSKKIKSPHIHTIIKRTYSRIPKVFENPNDSHFLFSSFHRFPIQNPHWEYETMFYNDETFYLSSIEETHLDRDGGVRHEFYEDERGITETTTIAISIPGDEQIVVSANSNGHVAIIRRSETGIFEDEDLYNLFNGKLDYTNRLNENETDKQKAYRDIIHKYLLENDEEDNSCQSLDEMEFVKLHEEANRRIIAEKDKYGNPLEIQKWFFDRVDYIEEYEYFYVENEKNK